MAPQCQRASCGARFKRGRRIGLSAGLRRSLQGIWMRFFALSLPVTCAENVGIARLRFGAAPVSGKLPNVSDDSRQLLLLILFRLMRSIAAGIIILVFPYYVLQSLHYGAFTLGLLYTAATLATAGFALLFGFLTDLWGHKGTLVLSGILLPAGALLAFSSGRLPVLFIATMLGGFSATGSRAAGSVGGAAQPIQSAVIADLTTVGNPTFYFSLFTFLSGLLGAAGMLATRLFSPRDAFLAAAVASAAGLVFLLPMKFTEKPRERKRMRSGKTI